MEVPEKEEEHCRICRCGVEEGELFHPCRCRGSVKYVHADCLKQWLNSSKREKKCDICKAPYQFKPLIPEDAPESLNPIIIFKELVVRNVTYYAGRYQGLILGIFLFVIVFPMILICAVRFYSLLIDSRMPKNDILSSILAGNMSTLGDSVDLTWPNLWKCIKYSYPTGVKLVILIVIILLQSIILHEWVSSDSGFQDLMNLQIGDEKISKYVDAFIRDFLQETFKSGIPNNALNRQELERLIELHELSFKAQARNIALVEASDEQVEREYEKARMLAYEKIREVVPFLDNLDQLDPTNPDQPILAQGFEEFEFANPADEPNQPVAPADAMPQILELAMEDDEEAAGGIGFDFNIRVEVQGGIKIFALAIAIFLVALVFIYYFPSLIGIILFKAIYGVGTGFIKYVTNVSYIKNLEISNEWVRFIFGFFKPIFDELSAVYNDQIPVSLTGRLIPLVTDLAIFYAFSVLAMHFLERSFRTKLVPLKGIGRKIYYVIFDIRSVLKVNVIFATEIVVFPVFCGLLLDFVSSPVFVHDSKFVSWDKALTSNLFYDFVKNDRFLIFVTYWSVGTTYMCLFATYVGMIRNFILRPGVLFFIRSPDDQNTRLIHDALVRPFGLQMSRIFLSGAVYTAFILVGFGVITFPMRYYSNLLPMKFNLFSTFTATSTCVLYTKLYKILVPVLKKFVRIYWFYAMRKAAQLTRLSSFIFGIDDVSERGKIVYRSTYHRIFARGEVDYTNPIDEDDLEEYFASHPDVTSAFVPDGNWMKAPDNDNVSRLYLRNLFYPCKSDGTNFEDFKPRHTHDRIDNLLGEKDEINEIRSHTIVFRPPNFGIRNFLFVTILWAFSAILILGIIISSHFFGLPFAWLLSFGGRYLPNWSLNVVFMGSFDDHYIDNCLRLSYTSIIFGLVAELAVLRHINKTYKINKIQLLKQGKPLLEPSTGEEIEVDEADQYSTATFIAFIRYYGINLIKLLAVVISLNIWGLSILFIHKYVIVAILSSEGLPKELLETDYQNLKSLDFQYFTPLMKLVVSWVLQEIRKTPKSDLAVQLVSTLFTLTPFVLAIRSLSYRTIVKGFKQFMRPQLSAALYLSFYSIYHTGSIVPGLIGTISSIQWEISFGFALVYYCYQMFSIFYDEVLLKNEEEIRQSYYAIGEVLMNCDEE